MKIGVDNELIEIIEGLSELSERLNKKKSSLSRSFTEKNGVIYHNGFKYKTL